MNKNIIGLIIGLMSAAVIGVMSLQIKFILVTRAEKEEQFDNHALEAMKEVSRRLESVEFAQVSRYANGYSIQQFEQQPNGYSAQQATSVSNNPKVLKEKLAAAELQQEFFTHPLAERIELVNIDNFLKQELNELGINIPFSYGVFSQKENGFVIFNNQYVIPKENQSTYDFLKNSEFKSTLFSSELKPPGALYLYFPSKSSLTWGGLWSVLLLSLLFAGVILACFGYTISVIFKQKKLSEMKTDFINNMTHEFKTPIATISLASDSITNPNIIGNPDKIRRFADIIKQENKRMNGQVEKVLQMALIERDKFKLNIVEIDLHDVIENALNNISLQVEIKEGVVSFDFEADKAVIEGDVNHISNVINNLLDNANKYSPEKPDIRITTRNVSNGIEFTVSDKGIGMSKEAKKRIFEKFYRVHTGNLHDVKGFGLGLTYVKAMITAHQGSIDVKSEVGKGSSFTVFLPFHHAGEMQEVDE